MFFSIVESPAKTIITCPKCGAEEVVEGDHHHLEEFREGWDDDGDAYNYRCTRCGFRGKAATIDADP